ncbi:DUF5691 domain-containing protein [Massilia aquatica]|uniref:HEAT repeat domain-containing protein n=1 Tax=Massilia aquatica TaxID=2609000 RepID=A0ABX0MJ63_9BURK|nr:DUF5691 domain-containing protein [Massilia aquatica]NHZ44312.1 HEAT repeat domain-containing protein [Massilia aquatica]
MSSPLPIKIHQTLQIGTSRAAPGFDDDLPPDLREGVRGRPGANTAPQEANLWLALAAHCLWQRAGYQPGSAAQAAPATPSCDSDALRPCPAQAEKALALLLLDEYPQVRPEWLRLANAHQCRLPPRLLPGVLDMGTAQRPLRSLIEGVLGTRGHWLAKQNPDWNWVGADTDDINALWEDGNIEQRAHALRDMRASDPGAAVQALQATWASETPDHRATLLGCLSVGLSLADEAFLESALDDKRKEVRSVAQRLLAGLPGSQLAQRMLARAKPLLRLERNGGTSHLLVEVPQERDKSMQRDGVGAGLYPAMGEKSSWVVDILAAVPPTHWSASFDASPRTCLTLAMGSEFKHTLLLGWSSALQRSLQAGYDASLHAWFTAFLDLYLKSSGIHTHMPRDFFSLFGTLPPDAADDLLATLVEATPAAWMHAHSSLIDLLDDAAKNARRNWPLALSKAVVSRIQAGCAANTLQSWSLGYSMATLALVLDPRAIEAYENGWPRDIPEFAQWEDTVDKFLRTLRFRHDMYLPFQEQSA